MLLYYLSFDSPGPHTNFYDPFVHYLGTFSWLQYLLTWAPGLKQVQAEPQFVGEYEEEELWEQKQSDEIYCALVFWIILLIREWRVDGLMLGIREPDPVVNRTPT